ncbi:PREDICTED: F-box/kelch-repeat protein At3g06240-like [Fragaria vesca subsp. vesca]|uniref:F-box/kelch-repeat protein At3g06240-like n=1 Tax=Fragaria vesca subsp. vesca TaxID=101020 RepID=UPI0002C2FA3F|nr:PREDICTED: F-box/kelch-repeat protein At3g06240-like [Fragaria vesca subsp. vesca]
MEANGELAGHRFPLPADIIVEILSRLPVKSLCRFRCVSKPWRSLIFNTKFIALHAKKALEDKEVFFRRRRVISNVASRGLYSMDLDEFLNHADNPHGSVTATELDFVRKEFDPEQQHKPPWLPFIYFCNNLLLCYTKKGIYLVNPATRQMKKVSKTPTWRPSPAIRMRATLSICGLGFDYSTNEYKVVDGQMYCDMRIVFSVYRLKTDSWRQIEYDTQYCPDYHQGISFNGAIHWSAGKAFGVGNRSVILTFLLAEEEFCEIQLPPIADTCSTILGVFRDCLCITLSGTHQTYDEFWVMKEYRASESWTKIRISMPYSTILSHIGFSTKSHDLMVYENSLIMYDFKKESGRKLQIRDIPKVDTCVGVYVEGLFPLTDQAREGREST